MEERTTILSLPALDKDVMAAVAPTVSVVVKTPGTPKSNFSGTNVVGNIVITYQDITPVSDVNAEISYDKIAPVIKKIEIVLDKGYTIDPII